MKRAALILDELNQISTITQLAGVFEGIASMEIAKIRDQTLASKHFFADLWHIYSQLRLDRPKKKSRKEQRAAERGRNLFVAITSQGGLSGDIDSQVINAMAADYDKDTTDIIVVGGHGSTLLSQLRIPVTQHLRMPDNMQAFASTVADPVIAASAGHGHTIAYYQTYASLSKQHVAKIELIAAVATLSEEAGEDEEIISPREYDFEPSLKDIVDYLESMMLGVVMTQVLLESKLSQAASRFNAMARAKQKAKEMQADLRLSYNRSKRAVSDERTREIIAVLNRT